VLDLARTQSPPFRNFAAVPVGGWGFGAGSGARGGFAAWDVKNVQFAASCRLGGVVLGWVVGNMVAIDNVVVPISRSELQSMRALKAEGAFPRARFGITDNRKWQLVLVAVPGSKEMNSLDVRRGA